MDLQTTFYTLGIIFMSMSILILIGIVILLFFITKKMIAMQKQIEEKINFIQNITSHPGEIAAGIGAAVAEGAVKQVKNFINKKTSK